MFQKSRVSGSVNLTMKRYDGRTKPEPREGRKPLPAPTEYSCLLRAQLKNRKISTIIHTRDVNKFQLAYASLLKGNIDSLKKREKNIGKIKSKATQ
ncbi:Uncharacterised protein g7378 [Pycnogonum litorale]